MGEEMASEKDAFRRAMARYLNDCRRRGLSADTLRSYGWALRTVHSALREADALSGPTTFGEEQARVAHEALARSPGAMWFLNAFLRRHGNEVLREIGLLRPFPQPQRIRWLDLETGEDLLVHDAALQLGPPYATLVHLELKLLFRRVSCVRSVVDHFGKHQVLVHGKGRHGGKLYSVAPHPETGRVLREHESWRVEQLGRLGAVSGILFPSPRTGRPYARSSMDEWVRRVEAEAGIRIGGHHTLRRTGGRKLWIAGVPLETIAGMMGHESVDETIRYLGIRVSDMAMAQRRLADYEASQRMVRVAAGSRPSGTNQSSDRA